MTARRSLSPPPAPVAFLPDFAGLLNNLSSRLSDLGRHEAALQAIEEAVTIRPSLGGVIEEKTEPPLFHVGRRLLFVVTTAGTSSATAFRFLGGRL
jgi:hypothetical protein